MRPPAEKIKIAIVDDHNLFRKGLIKLINLGDDLKRYHILFEAENGTDLKAKLNSNHLPDIILLDINMPDMDGYETVDWLCRSFPNINVLVVSMIETEESILRMLRMGVKGYLSKDIEVEDMHRALDAISSKGLYYSDLVSKVIAQNLITGENSERKKNESLYQLNELELEFIKFACTELTYQEIADKMNLSPKTIDGYRDGLFRKLKVKSRVSLAMYAVKNGIVKI
jgi:two-component system, NarL family, invasion response regulator UvrY